MNDNNIVRNKNIDKTLNHINTSNTKLKPISQKTNVAFYIIGFIGTLLLNCIVIFTFLMTKWLGGWGGGINQTDYIIMVVSVIIPLIVLCFSTYVFKYSKKIGIELRSCAKGSMQSILLTIVIMILFSIYRFWIYQFIPVDF